MELSRRIAATLWLLAPLACAAATAADADAPERNHVRFQVARDVQVANDRSVATLSITDEDKDPAALADRVNRAVRWGLDQAKQVEAVTPRTGGYQTHPISRDGKLRHWRARQELILESGDAEALAQLIGTLQERLQLSGIHHRVSAEARRAAEDALIGEALAAFRARAERIREGLGLSSYEIVDLHVGTGGAAPPPMPHMRTMAMESAVAAPAVEGGTSQVAVSVSGSIVLE